MKLTDYHIEELYKFTRQHFVEHYDVQTELVDHLANDIEEIWLEKPQISFEKAIDVSFKKFGVFGFMEVVEQKQKQMTRRYWRILWRFVKEWFTIPKVVITATIFILFYSLLQVKESIFVLMIALIILISFVTICDLIIRYKIKLKRKRKEKIFLLEEMIHRTKNGLVLICVINSFNFINLIKVDFSSIEDYWTFLMSFVLTIFSLIFYITEFVIPNKAEELLEETYPEYKLSQNV